MAVQRCTDQLVLRRLNLCFLPNKMNLKVMETLEWSLLGFATFPVVLSCSIHCQVCILGENTAWYSKMGTPLFYYLFIQEDWSLSVTIGDLV